MDEKLRRSFETRLARLEQQIKAFKDLHTSELQLIVDEIASFKAELAAMAPPPSDEPPAPLGDPAANSPKRKAWEAEQRRKEEERRAPLSRRELLRGSRDEDRSG